MNYILRIALLSTVALGCMATARAATDADWQALAAYQYGQDFKPLLDIERELIGAMNDAEKRQVCTQRLMTMLADTKTTLPAKQFICYQLQVLGTSDQVPLLAKMLDDAKTAEMARTTLEKIRGEKSLAVLRDGLKKHDGKLLLGLINSVATRKDTASIDTLKELADGKNAEVVDAALRALANIGGPAATEVVAKKVTQAGKPIPHRLAIAYLRCADSLAKAGMADAAAAIYARMSKPDVDTPNREAALEGTLDAAGDKIVATTI
ncbi:MAG: HEAT repeat domain-containing protein, partial [Pirellulales bacterium]|nr:HEAT repeat domain-containing protein [Pirellulales bacterium]